MGIYPRLFIPIFFIIATAIGIRYSLLIRSETANTLAQYQSEASQLGHYLSTTLRPLSGVADQHAARVLLSGAMTLNPDLADIDWHGAEPRLRLHLNRASAGPADYPSWFGQLAGIARLRLELPIVQPDGASARLTLSFLPTLQINRVWRTVSRQAMVSAVNIIMVYVLLALILASYQRALKRLSQAADRFQHGDHSARMSARGTREARLLAGTFNSMAGEVQTLVRSLRTSQKKLGDQLAQTRQMQTALQHMSWQNFHDVLTGLPNRAALTARFEQDLFLARERQAPLAVCLFDLDHFQQVNDRHGTQSGDELLKQVAERLQLFASGRHYSARLGGDEFVVLLADLPSVAAVEHCVARLLSELSAPYQHRHAPLAMSVSAGVAIYSGDALSADTLLRHADQALYQAKLTGRGRHHFFDAHLDAEVRTHHNQRTAIRDALLAGQFRLHYQPKVDMRLGHVVGMEALLRWQHPERGTIGPIQFLPLVDHTDLIIDIGVWVLRQALRQLQAWSAAGHAWTVSVNIAARHFQRPDFVARLSEILAEFPGAPAQLLELEILETSALGDIEHVRCVIMACQALGISFALDDFGTGYSSLSYLKRLPANVLKIDQSFVRNMLADQDDLHLVGAVIGLARSFKMAVIAEGVETVEHGTLLMRLGCDLAQGYGIARPMAPEAVLPWASAFRAPPAWQSAALAWHAELH